MAWRQNLLIRSCGHIDNIRSNLTLQTKHFKKAQKEKAIIISTGDEFDLMQGVGDKRSKRADLRPEHKVDDYYDAVVKSNTKFFAPWADLFAVIGMGNHESKWMKYHDTNPTQSMVDRLNDRTGSSIVMGHYAGYVIIRGVGGGKSGLNYVIKYHHGTSRQSTKAGAIKAAAEFPDADMIVSGHNHDAFQHPTIQERITSRGVMHIRKQWYLKLPSYKDGVGDGAEGYAVEKSYARQPLGAWWVTLRWCGEDDCIKATPTLLD